MKRLAYFLAGVVLIIPFIIFGGLNLITARYFFNSITNFFYESCSYCFNKAFSINNQSRPKDPVSQSTFERRDQDLYARKPRNISQPKVKPKQTSSNPEVFFELGQVIKFADKFLCTLKMKVNQQESNAIVIRITGYDDINKAKNHMSILCELLSGGSVVATDINLANLPSDSRQLKDTYIKINKEGHEFTFHVCSRKKVLTHDEIESKIYSISSSLRPANF